MKSPAPTTSASCVHGRAAPTTSLALGERRPRDSDAAASTTSPPEAQRTRLEDAGSTKPEPEFRTRMENSGAAEPEPQAPRFIYVCGQTHRNSNNPTMSCLHLGGKASHSRSLLPTQKGCAALHKTSAGEHHTKKANLLQRSRHPIRVPSTPALAHAPPTYQVHRAPTHTSALFTF